MSVKLKLMAGGWVVLGLLVGMSGVQADMQRNAMVKRLAPVGTVCLEGKECGTAMAVSAQDDSAEQGNAQMASAGDLDGGGLYNSLGCVACHANGVAGAPVYGDQDAWAPRIEQGAEALYSSVYNGKGAMPPRGGSGGSDEEIAAAVDHMIAEAQ